MSRRNRQDDIEDPQGPARKKRKDDTVFQATYLFITWPQNERDKQEIHDNMLQEYPNEIEWMVIANEDHEPTEDDPEAGIHSHMVMKFRKKRRVYHSVLDRVGGKHGNYQCKKGSNVQALTYVTKHGNYITYGFKDFEREFGAMKKKQSPKCEMIYKAIEEGKSIRDINGDPDLGSYLMNNLQKIEYYYERVQLWRSEPPIKYGLYDNISPQMNDFSRDLFSFIEVNLTYPRKIKQKQPWIVGPTDSGKSWLKIQLMHRFPCFMMGSKDPLKGYINNTYKIIILDEPRVGQYHTETMNRILEGGPFSIESRYTDVTKNDNPLVIVLTNYQPHEFYPNISQYGGNATYMAFLNRIELFQTGRLNPIRIWFDGDEDK